VFSQVPVGLAGKGVRHAAFRQVSMR
jgi:hypothetical protein